jgi:hypothetical protein
MKRRRNRINKYRLSESDTFKERLKRSNKSPLERMAELMAKYGATIDEGLKNMTNKVEDIDPNINSKLDARKVLNLIKEDTSDENSEERQIHD